MAYSYYSRFWLGLHQMHRPATQKAQPEPVTSHQAYRPWLGRLKCCRVNGDQRRLAFNPAVVHRVIGLGFRDVFWMRMKG